MKNNNKRALAKQLLTIFAQYVKKNNFIVFKFKIKD